MLDFRVECKPKRAPRRCSTWIASYSLGTWRLEKRDQAASYTRLQGHPVTNARIRLSAICCFARCAAITSNPSARSLSISAHSPALAQTVARVTRLPPRAIAGSG